VPITETRLAQSARHVAEGKRIVARQRELVAKGKAAGHDTFNAERLLDQFERTLAIFEDDLRAIQAKQIREQAALRLETSSEGQGGVDGLLGTQSNAESSGSAE